jgi:hypothetical protein
MIAAAAWAADPYAESARAKIDLIQEDQAPAGVMLPISAQEWNAWIRAELAEEPEIGLREPKLTLGVGSVTFEAIADLGKLAAHAKVNGIVAGLFQGERTRPETAAGKCTVRLDVVEISGVAVNGMLLNVVANLVLGVLFDDVSVNEPFEMGHRMDRAAIEPSGARIYIANVPPPAKSPVQ